MSTVADKPRKEIIVAPFGIEADHPRNCDLLLQCIPGERLRSAFDGGKSVKNRAGDMVTPRDQASFLASFPKTPGQQLLVNPAELTYKIIDPLAKDPALLDRVTKFVRNNMALRTDAQMKGVPDKEGKLDVHRMKSLCYEMLNLVNSGEAKLCKGSLPTEKELEELPGRELLNPGLQTHTTQPRYKDEWDAWVDRLTQSGG